MKVFTIAAFSLLRLMRERTTAFVTFLLPLLLIMLLGLLYGDPEYRVGLVVEDDGPLAVELADAIRTADGLEVTDDRGPIELLDAVAHNDRDAGIIIPAGYDGALRSGGDVVIEYMVTGDVAEFGVASVVDSHIVAQAARITAARFAGDATGSSFAESLEAAEEADAAMSRVGVRMVGIGDRDPTVLGTFDEITARMMLLFVFLIAAAGSSDLIKSRNLGMSRRMLGTPTSATTIIGGETAGRFLVAISQSMVIVVVAALVFGVDWRNWPATLAVLIAYALAAAGAGMLLGSLVRSAQLAESLGTFIALGLGMLGGLMGGGGLPVPQGWADEAFQSILVQGAGLTDVAAPVGMLLLYAAAFMGIAAPALRRSLTRSGA